MRLTIVALGSRGDVQPFIALGLGLQRRGHRVRLAAAADYGPLVQEYGLEFAPLVGSIRELMDRQMVAAMIDRVGNPLEFITGMMNAVRPLIVRLVADVYSASSDAEALVVSTLGLYASHDVAEKLHIPLHVAHMHPNAPTRAYPHLFLPRLTQWLPLHGAYNRLSYGVTDAAYWAFIFGPLNRARREVLDLTALTPRDIIGRVNTPLRPVLHAYSPLVTRRPPDWDRGVHVTGYWFLDPPPGWAAPAGLEAFIEDGEPPVYVGFGSNLVGSDPNRVTEVIVRALERVGRRGILMSGWGDLGNIPLPESIYKVEQVPHSWLFPRVAAAVSHGGAGTVAATLRAGVPAVIVPFFGDQLFWARRVARMGLGPDPVPRHDLTEEGLAAAIQQATSDQAMRTRAAAMGRRIAVERGVEQAVDALPLAGSKFKVQGSRFKVQRGDVTLNFEP